MSKFNLIENLFINKFDVKSAMTAHYARNSNKEKEDMTVSIDKIYPCQNMLDGNKVIECFLLNKDGKELELAEGVKVEDKVYLYNGHHRVAAQILSGKTDVEIKVISLTKDEWQKLYNKVNRLNK